MNKQANIQKAIMLMKSKGMSAEKALKTVYPDWDDAKIQKAAMTIRTMDKTAAVMQVSSAMAELDKTAADKKKVTFSPAMDKSPLLKGKQSKLPDQIQAKILKGKLKKEAKLRVHNIEDELGEYFSDKQEAKVRKMIAKERGKSFSMRHPLLTGIPTLGIAPTVANNKAKQKIVRKLLRSDKSIRKSVTKRHNTALKRQHEVDVAAAGATKNYSETNIKTTAGAYAPAVEKVGSAIPLEALKYASNAMYASHVERVTGIEKSANIVMRTLGIPTAGAWGARGSAIGAGVGGLGEVGRLLHMTTPAGRAAHAKSLANYEKAVAGAGEGGLKRMMPWGKPDAAKGQIGLMNNAKADAEFLKKFDALQKGGGFAKNPAEYMKLFAPNVLKNMAAGGAAGGLAGAGAGAIAGNMAKKRLMNTAKTVAVPAALGLGGLAALS